MQRRFRVLAALGATSLPIAAADAGVTAGSIDSMQIASGFLDIENPSSSTFTDSTSIDAPPNGAFLDLQAIIPGNRSFLASLDLTTSAGEASARLDFGFEAATIAFETSSLEFFFSGGRVTVSSPVDLEIRFEGLLAGSGGAAAFLYVYGTPAPTLFVPSAEPVLAELDLGPGVYTLAWGVLIGEGGGSGDLAGSLSFNFVPNPGVAALLGMAGLAAPGRRRR